MESLSAYACRFLEQMDDPDVDTIEQKTTSKNRPSKPTPYTKVFDPIRAPFAMTPEARARLQAG